jgi:adenylylsulfate reductase subunit B
MPTYVNPDKCDGCKAQERPACMYICPMNLMKLNPQMGKSYNHEPDLCWECYSCVKTCPQSAIEMRGGADYFPMGATLTPLRGTAAIAWTARYRNGDIKRFKFPIRSTLWGTIDPHPAVRRPRAHDLKDPTLFGEDHYLGVDRLPVPARKKTIGRAAE